MKSQGYLPEEEIRRRAAGVYEVFTSMGHLPRHPANHVPIEEGRLNTWWNPQMRLARDGMLAIHVAQIFDEEFPTWRQDGAPNLGVLPVIELPPFDEQLEQLRVHLAENGVFPSQQTPLGRWLFEQRRLAGRGELGKSEISALDAVALDWRAPGVRSSKVRAQKWAARVQQLRKFVTANGRLPEKSPEASAAEKDLHAWLRYVGEKDLDVVARADLDEAAPGWEEFLEKTKLAERAPRVKPPFVDFANELARFIAEHDHVPTERKPADPDETALARKLSYYRTRFRQDRLNNEQIVLLYELVPRWLEVAQDSPDENDAPTEADPGDQEG